jgi:hypothetical protein
VQLCRPRDSSLERGLHIGRNRPCLRLYLVSGVSKDEKTVLTEDEFAVPVTLGLRWQVMAAMTVELNRPRAR